MSVIPPLFLDCVVALGNKDGQGHISWVASGFLYGTPAAVPESGWPDGIPQYEVWLVTNRHVIKSLSDMVVRFDSDSGGAPLALSFLLNQPDGAPAWGDHPDPDVDVSVTLLMAVNVKNAGAKVNFFEKDRMAATLAELQAHGVSEGQSGFLLGYPMGLVGGATNAVIVRQATIARIRDAYQGHSKYFLVDGTVFPGNSGGAAIVRPEPVAVTGTQSLQNAFLVGVVAAYVPYEDVAYSLQTMKPRITFEENSGLTVIYPVETIDETIAYLRAQQPSPPSP